MSWKRDSVSVVFVLLATSIALVIQNSIVLDKVCLLFHIYFPQIWTLCWFCGTHSPMHWWKLTGSHKTPHLQRLCYLKANRYVIHLSCLHRCLTHNTKMSQLRRQGRAKDKRSFVHMAHHPPQSLFPQSLYPLKLRLLGVPLTPLSPASVNMELH